jgi:anti-sigma factor RsiW
MAMNGNMETLSEREEIEMLLPWYVTGKLDRADRERVEAYLSQHPELLSQLALIRDEQDQAIRANEAISAPSARAVDRLLAQVQGSASVRAASAWLKLKSGLQDLFEVPSPAGVRWAAVAAAILILFQTVVIGTLVFRGGEASYQTASGEPAQSGEGTFVLVRFADAATARTIADALAELDMTIVDGPKSGLFRVRLGPKDMTNDARDLKVTALRSRGNLVMMV